MNNKESQFGNAPTIKNMPTSVFEQNSNLFTTMNTGSVTPIFVNEVYPGDIFDMDTNVIMRSQTPITASMDNAFLDIGYYFVPNRII